KPDNVLRSDDGRLLVADFGLACLDPREPRPLADVELLLETTDDGPLPEFAISETGELEGTPAYMPPEQFLGRAVDARADQFALCVSLYEALWDRRPFPEASIRARLEAMIGGGPTPPDKLRGVP